MGFALYSVTETDGVRHILRKKPLRVGGPDGVIARHLAATAPDDGDGPLSWKLDTPAILAIAGEPDDATWVVFESDQDGAGRALQRVHGIHGVSEATETDLLITLESIDPQGSRADLGIEATTDSRLSSEPLRLLGGTRPGTGSWRWSAPKMQIGAALLGGGRSD